MLITSKLALPNIKIEGSGVLLRMRNVSFYTTSVYPEWFAKELRKMLPCPMLLYFITVPVGCSRLGGFFP